MKKLIAKGADVNARTKRTPPPSRGSFRFAPAGEQTPLLFAARANHVDVMKALVAAGADPSLKAQDGTTLLMAAAGAVTSNLCNWPTNSLRTSGRLLTMGPL